MNSRKPEACPRHFIWVSHYRQKKLVHKIRHIFTRFLRAKASMISHWFCSGGRFSGSTLGKLGKRQGHFYPFPPPPAHSSPLINRQGTNKAPILLPAPATSWSRYSGPQGCLKSTIAAANSIPGGFTRRIGQGFPAQPTAIPRTSLLNFTNGLRLGRPHPQLPRWSWLSLN